MAEPTAGSGSASTGAGIGTGIGTGMALVKGNGKRGNLSTSPLARPRSLIHMLAGRVQEYLYFPTPDPLYVVLGTVAANMLQGVPVWVMLVGVPSCQPAGSKVLMANGHWKNIQDVRVDDLVISPQRDGTTKAVKVLQTIVHTTAAIYQVSAKSKGSTKHYFCSGEHRVPFVKTWYKYILGSGRKAPKKIQPQKLYEMRAEDFVTMSKVFKSKSKAFTSPAIELPQQWLSVHPYVMGALLGDGGFSTPTPRFSSQEPKMFARLEQLGVEFGAEEKRAGFVMSKNIVGATRSSLKLMPVYGRKSKLKYVPDNYKYSSLAQRLELLAGLIDTDGTACEFTSTSKRLAEDFVWLVQSVGGHASISERWQEPSKLIKTRSYQYRVYFHFGKHLPPLTLDYKKRVLRKKKLNVLHKQMEVKNTGKEDAVFGFILESESGWYVTDDWLVTHNSGRTVLLEAMANIPKIHIVGVIKSPSALLSGVAQKDKSKAATGGLLRQIGARGMLVMKDFTSMLSMPREPLAESIGALREVYDGRWSRPLGTEGGRVLEWKGKIGFLGACTPALDRHYSVTGELGERWIYYRYAETDGYGETIKALGIENPEQMMEELRDLILSFMQTIELTWDGTGTSKRMLTDQEKNKLYAIASVCVAARSPVPRDPKTHEVVDIAQKEAPTRLSSALGQLYLGLEAIGLEADEAWWIVGRMALDSAPQIRTKVLLLLKGVQRFMGDPKSGGLTMREIRECLRCSTRTTAIVVEDLAIHGLAEKIEKKTARMDTRSPEEQVSAGLVRLTEWGRKQMELGWGKPQAL